MEGLLPGQHRVLRRSRLTGRRVQGRQDPPGSPGRSRAASPEVRQPVAAARRPGSPGTCWRRLGRDIKSLLHQQRTVPGYVIERVCEGFAKLTQARRDPLPMRTVINRVLALNSPGSPREGSANQPRTAWTRPSAIAGATGVAGARQSSSKEPAFRFSRIRNGFIRHLSPSHREANPVRNMVRDVLRGRRR